MSWWYGQIYSSINTATPPNKFVVLDSMDISWHSGLNTLVTVAHEIILHEVAGKMYLPNKPTHNEFKKGWQEEQTATYMIERHINSIEYDIQKTWLETCCLRLRGVHMGLETPESNDNKYL